MASRTVEVKIVGDERDLSRAFRSASRDAQSFSGKLGSSMAKVTKLAGGVALALGGGLAAGVGVGIKSLMEHEKANAQLASRLKSTGNAANTSVEAISSLADAIEKKSGIDDVAIKSAAGLVLAFKNVKNSAGAGNDIFDRTIELTADLSAALGIEATAAAKTLGKALDDPTKAAGALRKMGVTLTEQQREQIKAMVEAGDVMGAQKIILGELETRYGTAAEAAGSTMAGRLQILKARLEEVAEKVASAVLPIFERLVAWVEEHWPTIETVISAVFSAVGTVINSVLVPALRAAAEAGQWLVGKVREHWDQIKNAIQIALNGAKAVINIFVGAAKTIWSNFGETITQIAERMWSYVKTSVENTLNIIRGIIKTITALIHGDWGKAWEGIKQVVSGVLDQIVNIITTAWDVFKTVATALGRKIWEGVKAGVSGLTSLISDAFHSVVNAITGLASDAWSAAKSLGGKIVDGIGDALSSLKDKMVGWIKAPINAIIGAWNNLGIPSFKVHIPLPFGQSIDFGTPSITLPDIPLLGDGGIVTRPTLAVIGEAGPEAVVPLNRRSSVAGMGVTLNVYPNGAAGQDAQALAAALSWRLRTMGAA